MKLKLLVYIILPFAFINTNAQKVDERSKIPLLENWTFKKADALSEVEKPEYDDSHWRMVNIPHDWSIEDLPAQSDSVIGPFAMDAVSGFNTGFTVGGTAWYRKSFKLEQNTTGKTVYINFDGAYMNSDVWINGHHLGNRPNGYVPFYYDITPYLNKAGEENIIAVEIKNEGVNSRWYSGSGLTREVWLEVVNPVHIDVWGVYITTPVVGKNKAEVQVTATINNNERKDKTVDLFVEIVNNKGEVVATTRSRIETFAGRKSEVKSLLTVLSPGLWSPDNPIMYNAIVSLEQNKSVIDRFINPFGMREIKLNVKDGLTINGVPTLLYGGCIHHDNGPLGAVDMERAVERKLEILKKNGFNAVRTAHNPFSKTFLDVCDRMGMLVIEEAFDMWNNKKTENDYSQYFQEWYESDLTNILMRDRNHPSIIFWSIGNEIRERVDSLGYATRHQLKTMVKALDSSRYITECIQITPKWDERTPAAFAELDVCGYNYQWNRFEKDHKNYPDRIMLTTESYPNKAYDSWTYVEKYPFVIGDFVWTAVDYMGEAGLGVSGIFEKSGQRTTVEWPMYNANCGDIDLIGNKKPQSYYRDVVWERSVIEMFVREPVPQDKFEFVSWWGWPDVHRSWSWPGMEGDTLQVDVYSKASKVKLFLNDQEVVALLKPEKGITFSFKLPYSKGKLVAKAYEGNKELGQSMLKTVGEPAAIRLIADKNKIHADNVELSYISVEIIDAEGNLVPYVDDIDILFEITGTGKLATVGNSNFKDMSSMHQPIKKVFHGKALAIVKSDGKKGKSILTASADGLAADNIELFIE